jgi:UDP-N-acetylglucosamine 2-epimerase (non-hydrolysing)
MKAYCAISDSGTIAEESAILDFPAITTRDAIERPEAMDTGNIIVTGLDQATIFGAIEAAVGIRSERTANNWAASIPRDYTYSNTSERVLKLIIGTALLSNQWDGIRENDQP